MRKICTNIGQSRRLASLGMDISKADFAYVGEEGPFLLTTETTAEMEGMTPAWSLDVLMDALPHGTLFLSQQGSVHADFRGNNGETEIALSSKGKRERIDAVCELVISYLENKRG